MKIIIVAVLAILLSLSSAFRAKAKSKLSTTTLQYCGTNVFEPTCNYLSNMETCVATDWYWLEINSTYQNYECTDYFGQLALESIDPCELQYANLECLCLVTFCTQCSTSTSTTIINQLGHTAAYFCSGYQWN